MIIFINSRAHCIQTALSCPSHPRVCMNQNFKYLFIDLRDKANSNILSCIPASNLFIEAGAKSGGIFVHWFVYVSLHNLLSHLHRHCASIVLIFFHPCSRGGKSRSPALVIAYLMTALHWSFKKCHAHLMERRPLIEVI